MGFVEKREVKDESKGRFIKKSLFCFLLEQLEGDN